MEKSRVELKVEGMTCPACVRSVRKKLSGVAGVESAQVDLGAAKATVEYDVARAEIGDLIGAVDSIGYHASPL
jgi:copper chaperone CopZ